MDGILTHSNLEFSCVTENLPKDEILNPKPVLQEAKPLEWSVVKHRSPEPCQKGITWNMKFRVCGGPAFLGAGFLGVPTKGHCNLLVSLWGFLKTRGTFSGVPRIPRIRIIAFWGLYKGVRLFGETYQIEGRVLLSGGVWGMLFQWARGLGPLAAQLHRA